MTNVITMKQKKIGLKEAKSIGIGVMVGGGVFAVLGLAAAFDKPLVTKENNVYFF